MRVDLLTREYPPNVYGGAGVHVTSLARYLRQLVDLRVHCYGEREEEDKVIAHRVPAALREANGALQAIAVSTEMAAAVQGADAAHSHTWYTNLAGHLARQLYEIPHVITAHSLEPRRPWKAEQLGGGYSISSSLESTAFLAADRIIAVSQATAQDILDVYPGVDPARIEVVHNGIDTDVYAPDPDSALLHEFGVRTDRPIVACVARITPQKGLVHLLEAAPHFASDSRLVIVAQSADTPALASDFAARIAALRARGVEVDWIRGDFPRAALIQLLSHAAAFVCPSVYETLPIVNLEAMACAAPVVATRTGGIPELIVEGETGFMVPLSGRQAGGEYVVDHAVFAKEIAARVNALLDSPGRAALMGQAGRARVVADFTWKGAAERVSDIYRAVA